MTVNGLELPASFVEFYEREWNTGWHLKERVDAYGYPLNVDFEPLVSVERMEQFTPVLAQYFMPPDHYRGEGITPELIDMVRQQMAEDPSFLFDITDFSKIACFGRSPTGAPFCFDFRENLREPSVIHHDDYYGRWRRIAPNFETLISLFERYRGEE